MYPRRCNSLAPCLSREQPSQFITNKQGSDKLRCSCFAKQTHPSIMINQSIFINPPVSESIISRAARVNQTGLAVSTHDPRNW